MERTMTTQNVQAATASTSSITEQEIALLESISKQYLDIDILADESIDALDFHACVKLAVKDGLKAAYEAGKKIQS